MIRPFVADLHVHSLLSPCAAVEMTPRNIVRHAAAAGVDLLAITDHNAADNVKAALQAAVGSGVTVWPGMEVETKEEIHVLALFDKMHALQYWQYYVEQCRSKLRNDPNRFGAQFVVDAEDNLLAEKPEMLLAPLTGGIAEISRKIHELGGLCIASHVDRPAYSILSQLGFIPDDVELDAIEVSGRILIQDAALRFPAIAGRTVIRNSDAHTINDFLTGPKTVFYVEEPTVAELRLALRGQAGRHMDS